VTALEVDAPLVERLLVGFVRDEIASAGLSRAVLGLSGGIDSAVSAALAARALGPQNVLCICMPYRTSNPQSLADARIVAESLGTAFDIVEITPAIDAYFATQPDADALRRGNKMARERMTVLYDRSAAFKGLVVGTSNKTELLLGYGTLFGDMASALNPIGDLYKTQVFQFARHLALPAAVISKPPSADLWAGQTDEQEMGFSYDAVDSLLLDMVERRMADEELHAHGHDPAFVQRVRRMIVKSQFKRRMPLIAKLTDRTINADFRYPRDWGV
jgi:NAD+ synthase